MIVVKTKMRKIPDCCRKCIFYDSLISEYPWRVSNKNDGCCTALSNRATHNIIVSRERLKNCPLVEETE